MNDARPLRRLTDGSPRRDSATRRAAAVALAEGLLRRWQLGEGTNDAELLAERPDLMPELGEELRHARIIRRALLAGRKAGPSEEPPPRLLSDDELEAPILLPNGESRVRHEPLPPRAERRPRIPGCVLLEEVSQGGQATVYRALHESTGRTVAAKVLAGGSLSDSTHRARFDREAEILASLRHPHVVDILDRGRTPDGDFYLLMEFVDGCEFDEWWRRRVPADEDGTRSLLTQFSKICRAVQAAHSRGIVHRDLKPSNVRVDALGEPRVLDFGLARESSQWTERGQPNATHAVRAVTVSGQLLGSIPWASPEQAAGGSDRVDARSDVYSLGVMLYQAFAGDFPYRVDGPLYEVLDRIARAPVLPPSASAGGRPFGPQGALDAIVLRAVAKDPAARYASAGALADDLDRLLAGRIPATRSPRRTLRLRHAAVVTASLAAVAAILQLGVLRGAPAPPVVFDLPSTTSSAGMRFVRLPAGTFNMGSAERQEGRDPSERQRFVKVESFYVAVTEVTQRQYEQVMGPLPREQQWSGPDLPVHNVTWHEAAAFCRRLSATDGRTYRLPSEPEWEYACRAGSPAAFFTDHGPDRVAWYANNSGNRLHPVAEKWPNSWGIYDAHGNVREWCGEPFKRPAGGLASESRSSGPDLRVLRGGGAMTPTAGCRAAARAALSPTGHLPDVGFRVVLEPD